VTDTSRVLLTAAVLSGLAIGAFVWRLIRSDPSQPERLVGELRLAQFGSLLVAAMAGAWLGLAVSAASEPFVAVDLTLAIAYLAVAVIAMQREPRTALLLVSAALVVHALIDIAHRPGWLSSQVAPAWFVIGCAAYNIVLAVFFFWAQRR